MRFVPVARSGSATHRSKHRQYWRPQYDARLGGAYAHGPGGIGRFQHDKPSSHGPAVDEMPHLAEGTWEALRRFIRMNASADKEVASSGSTLMIVENNVIVRMAVSAYLRECGYKVIEARDGAEAILVLHADIKIDVVLTEVDLPGKVDGFALATRIRREQPEIKVVLTSGVKRSAKDAGALCEEGPVLAKPYDHGHLERHIRQLLAAGAA